MPVETPFVVVMFDVPLTLPTVLTLIAVRVALPPTETALVALELSYSEQPLSATWTLPCSDADAPTVASSARTHPTPNCSSATARAVMVSVLESHIEDSRRVCVCAMITSTAPLLAVCVTVQGGRCTVTVVWL